ncbi:MAG: formate dehydrogenase subunit gamma [Gammaproteobacteria bacterium]
MIIRDPGSDLWRNIRQRDFAISGTTQMKAPDANILINVAGEFWRQYRTMELIPKAGIALFLALFGVFLFRILRGKVMLAAGRSGKKILRFTLNQRVVHWTTAILFIILALTGLILLFGRGLLIPVFGAEGFGTFAIVAKALHNYLGPVFAVSLVLLFVLFIKGNQISLKRDLEWLRQGGGLFGKHASADCYNAGEKGWFWIATLVGSAIIVSGMVLDFPIFGQTRATMEYYLVIHGIASVIMIVASFGHIYMGTAALEGTFEVMKTGYCDTNWAQEHHDRWYEKKMSEGEGASDDAEGGEIGEPLSTKPEQSS